MGEVQRIDHRAVIRLRSCKPRLTRQQYRTLRGQVFAGDSTGAMKGLDRLLARKKEAGTK